MEHSDPNHTRANEVEETREKNLFDGIDHYLKTGEVDANTFYAGSHGDWIAEDVYKRQGWWSPAGRCRTWMPMQTRCPMQRTQRWKAACWRKMCRNMP